MEGRLVDIVIEDDYADIYEEVWEGKRLQLFMADNQEVCVDLIKPHFSNARTISRKLEKLGLKDVSYATSSSYASPLDLDYI